jgi:hypothetical protein
MENVMIILIVVGIIVGLILLYLAESADFLMSRLSPEQGKIIHSQSKVLKGIENQGKN